MPDAAQIAYDAYTAHRHATSDYGAFLPTWGVLPQEMKDAWNMAVAAVIETQSTGGARPPECFHFVKGQYVSWVMRPDWHFMVIWRQHYDGPDGRFCEYGVQADEGNRHVYTVYEGSLSPVEETP